MSPERTSNWLNRFFWVLVLAGSVLFLNYWFFIRKPGPEEATSRIMEKAARATQSVLEMPTPKEPLLEVPPDKKKPIREDDVLL